MDFHISVLPQIPKILRFTGLFDDGTIASIQCDSTGSRPAANITWFLDGKKLHDVRQQISQETDGTYTTSGFLTKQLSKEMDGKVLTCAAENKVLLASGRLPVTTNVTLLAMCMYPFCTHYYLFGNRYFTICRHVSFL